MPWVSESVGAGGRRYRLPGVYQRLLREKCAFETEPDPRQMRGWTRDDQDRVYAVAASRAEAMFEELLQGGEPFTVAAWWVHGRAAAAAPDWLTKPAICGGAVTVRVYGDDTIEPAAFYGAAQADGTWQVIPADAVG
jgi:hypothetical protein